VPFEPCCLATGIGSLPHAEVERAIELVASTIPEVPYMPQMPALSWHEGMMVQYTEGIPGRTLDEQREKIHLDTDAAVAELEDFYTRVIADDPDAFAISADHCRGLPGLQQLLKDKAAPVAAKTQLTGPVTQGLSTVDQGKRAIYYDETFQEVLVKSCVMKARWLVRQLKPHGPAVLCFLDEPILSAFGSSVYVSVKREDVIAQISEVANAIRGEGGKCGVHCCGNTDWSLLTEAGVDIISFDAFEFAYSLPLYPDAIKAFLLGGGVVAWGVVPTSQVVLEQSVDTLADRLHQAMAKVEELGVPRRTLLRQALLTPACGLGSTSVKVAETAFDLLRDLSQRMREEAAAA
jgi:methionine synthase II (cobalamin-independent)